MGQAVINSVLNDLEAQANLTAIIGTNIYPQAAPDDMLPVMVYQASDGIRERFYVGSFGLQTDTMSMNFYSEDYDQLTGIRDILDARYHGFSGNLTDGTTVSLIENTVAIYSTESGNSNIYRLSYEIDIIT